MGQFNSTVTRVVPVFDELMARDSHGTSWLSTLLSLPHMPDSSASSLSSRDWGLNRHAAGDWGEVDEEDWASNDQALVDGSRLLSAYRTLKGVKIWVITEAADDNGQRASTCCLLPEDY